MPKLKLPHQAWLESFGEGHEEYLFHCPGCKQDHRYIVRWGSTSGRSEPTWSFSGGLDKPSFQPSLLYRRKAWPTDEEQKRIMAGEKVELPDRVCHLYMTDGRIQFLGDCTHQLAGKTVEMEEVPSG